MTNLFGYNLSSEVTNAVMGANAYGYAYDPIGNRKQSAIDDGQAADGTAYAANLLNQYAVITNSAFSASPREISPTYDLNGNMTWDGTNAYFWDVQNQLILVSNFQFQVSNAYDAMGRRVRKSVSRRDAETQSWEVESTRHFFYDGWNVIRETIAIGNQQSAITNLYTWGSDLSGTLQGAGGVGGLLAVLSSGSQPYSLTAYYPLFDHNGNIERYVTRSGATVAVFQYDAFGNTISETFTQSGNNAVTHFRFSTKYWDNEVGLYYYGYRFYRPGLGRWVNRDPYEENGGENIVMYVGNNCMNIIDKFGLFSFRPSECRETCKENTRSNFSPYRIYIGPLSPTDAATWDAVLLFADVLSAMPTGIKPSDIASWISSNIVVPTHEIADKLKDLLTQRIPWDVYLLYTVTLLSKIAF